VKNMKHIKSSRIAEQSNQLRMAGIFSLLANLILAVVKWVAGYLGNSYALIADAIESIMDALASILFVLGIRYAAKPPDENHPYGHGRAEPLITFVVVGFLFLSAGVISITSIQNIMTPQDVPEPFTLYVLLFVIGIKEIIFRVLLRKSIKTKSSALKAEAWHHRGDAITSVAAFIGISIALLFGKEYAAADDWAALFAAGFILFNAYQIFRPALGEMMDEHFYDDLIVEIRSISHKVDGVIDTEKCFIRKTGLAYHVDLHLTVNGGITVEEGHEIAHMVKNAIMLEIPEIADILIHVEPGPGGVTY
jgi:cation diffusion facilitator family transporter